MDRWTRGHVAARHASRRDRTSDHCRSNAGIVNLASAKDSVTAGVRNTGAARTLTIVFDVDGVERARTTLAVGKDQTAQAVAALAVPRGSRLALA